MSQLQEQGVKCSLPLKWHTIPGFSKYKVGDDGSIWSFRHTPRKLKPYCRKCDGRKRYTLCDDYGVYHKKYGSYFVLLATAGPRPSGMEACHNDGDCRNDRPINLRWDTPLANKRDMQKHGTQVAGERHPKAKIRDSDIPVILQMRKSGTTYKAIGQSFGVSEQRIFQIYKKGGR